MVSHKSLSINDPVKSTPSYVRQSLSATRVIGLLNAEAPETLPPLPIVPYSLSVALSVVYRHFRSRRLKVHINRATDELKQCVTLLNRLRSSWWSAGTMADLGTAVLNNADRGTRTANTPATIPGPAQPSSDDQETQTKEQQLTALSNAQWQQRQPSHLDGRIDPRLQPQQTTAPISGMLNSLPTPGQHPTSSERADRMPLPPAAPFDFSEASPDWLNFDAAFENFEGLLGGSGADFSNELFKPLGYEGLEFLEPGPV